MILVDESRADAFNEVLAVETAGGKTVVLDQRLPQIEMASGANGVVEAMRVLGTVVESNAAATEEMAAQAGQMTSTIDGIASISSANSAATEEVSAAAEEMNAQVEEMNAQAEELAATADALNQLVAQFHIGNRATARGGSVQGRPHALRRVG